MAYMMYLWPLLVSFGITVGGMPYVIRYFRQKQLGQTTLDDGPVWHREKSGTPTMGGVMLLSSVIVTTLLVSLVATIHVAELLVLVMVSLLFGGIGFADDYIKVMLKRNLGVTSKQKFIAQLGASLVVYIVLSRGSLDTTLMIPFMGQIDLSIMYAFFVVFWLVGFSNATNLTDGIDGLLASTSIVGLLAYAVIAIVQKQFGVLYFIAILLGSMIGFFLFNRKPARIFMGDVGSLAVGAMFATVSILLKQEWTLLMIGIVYVIETASVMLQVAYFKRTGKRIFKMTPIHHHFEMDGCSEWQIVGLFSVVTLICSVVVIWGIIGQ